MKFWRSFARFWMGFVLGADFLAYSWLLLDTEDKSGVYTLAHEFNWNISPTWAAVTYPTIIAMMWLAYDVIFLNRPMGAVTFGFLTIISLLWAVDLFLYETFVLDLYHWTKIVDGIRWVTFFYAAWWYKFRSSPWS